MFLPSAARADKEPHDHACDSRLCCCGLLGVLPPRMGILYQAGLVFETLVFALGGIRGRLVHGHGLVVHHCSDDCSVRAFA